MQLAYRIAVPAHADTTCAGLLWGGAICLFRSGSTDRVNRATPKFLNN
jgi:hypothetical protein